MIKTDEAPMRLRLDERTRAGRLGLQLVAARAALAEARASGHLDEIEHLERRERVITADLISAVMLPSITFGTFGVQGSAGMVPVHHQGECA